MCALENVFSVFSRECVLVHSAHACQRRERARACEFRCTCAPCSTLGISNVLQTICFTRGTDELGCPTPRSRVPTNAANPPGRYSQESAYVHIYMTVYIPPVYVCSTYIYDSIQMQPILLAGIRKSQFCRGVVSGTKIGFPESLGFPESPPEARVRASSRERQRCSSAAP